jgi:hypothetical protein
LTESVFSGVNETLFAYGQQLVSWKFSSMGFTSGKNGG